MKFYVMTLFPQMILDGLNTSITGRAIESGALCVEAVDIRDFSKNKHMKVDDYPYGGGAGMVMQAGPVCDAYESIAAECKKKTKSGIYDSAGAYIQPEYGRRVCKRRRACYIMWTL